MPGPPSLCAGGLCLHGAWAWETEPHFLGLLARSHLSLGSENPTPSWGNDPSEPSTKGHQLSSPQD